MASAPAHSIETCERIAESVERKLRADSELQRVALLAAGHSIRRTFGIHRATRRRAGMGADAPRRGPFQPHGFKVPACPPLVDGRPCRRICRRPASAPPKRVGRLMREEGLRARLRKRFRSKTMSEHDQRVAANVLDRQFAAERSNQRWVGDTTEFENGHAKLYLAAILDLYSRFNVGWALSAVNDRHLTLRGLDMAVKRRCPDSGCCVTPTKGQPMPARIIGHGSSTM